MKKPPGEAASSELARDAKMKAKLQSLYVELQADAAVWNTDGTLTRPKSKHGVFRVIHIFIVGTAVLLL
jgi:hypothetical protein